ncbi:ATP-dependent zinc protease [Thalassotalea aquiviva]|uniref:ATP-dependent zinc protease family protein n=1 Tax=Thalassotalea aquiviva TaxID=3242415 RepID=UPI003529F771
MLKPLVLLPIFTLLLACVSTIKPNDADVLDIETIDARITASEQRLASIITANCQFDESKMSDGVATKVKSELQETLTPVQPSTNMPAALVLQTPPCEPKGSDKQHSIGTLDKILIGEVEKIFFIKEQLNFDARIDSGAVSSSLGVYHLTRFERDGEKWVRFTLESADTSTTYEYPITRMIKIVQQKGAPVDNRPVIEMQFSFGNKNYVSNFNLADRSHLEYQVLIGREFLKDIAIIDVSQKYVLGSN